MTTFTAAALLDRVRKEGDYENSTVLTDAVMLPWLSAAHGEYCDLLDEEWAGYRDTTATLTATAGSATLALPNDFLKARALHLLHGNLYRALDPFEPTHQVLGYDDARGVPVGYLHVGASVELYPTPDAAYTLRLRYVPAAPALTSTSDTIDVPNGWEDFHVAKVLMKAAKRDERPLSEDLAIVDRVRARVRQAASQRNVTGPRYLPFPGEGEVWP